MAFLHSGYNFKINLSAEEMLEISQEISRNFTPCFSNPVTELAEKIRFSPSELLNIGEEIGRDFAPRLFSNDPELMLLPVDPGHLYAYWNLGENREIPRSASGGTDLLTLRVYSQPDQESAVSETVSWFDVAIDSPMTQQQVSLPSPVDEMAYSAAIGTCGVDDSFIELAHSNIIHTHGGQTAWRQNFTDGLNKNVSGLGINK